MSNPNQFSLTIAINKKIEKSNITFSISELDNGNFSTANFTGSIVEASGLTYVDDDGETYNYDKDLKGLECLLLKLSVSAFKDRLATLKARSSARRIKSRSNGLFRPQQKVSKANTEEVEQTIDVKSVSVIPAVNTNDDNPFNSDDLPQ